MDPHHRKIDLQSPQDLTYLLANIHAAAQQKLDIHFPPSAAPKGEEDAFRTRVEQLVQEYITHTLTLALPSLSINGLDASPALVQLDLTPSSSAHASSEPNYEAYDPRLAAKLRSLYSTLESETTKVAELRREAPGKAAALYMERLREEMEVEERVVEESRRWGIEAGGGELLEITGPRGVGVGESWEGAVRGLEKLGGGVTEAVARLERVRGVVEGVEGG